ncbi:fibulin-7 isoform X2 [Lepisosteus oculatus]|uniref:fibulin-7 isoform X2 n=1 Tax=Lepisosteus oculatus TaxID=7918 RepID=UPI0035F50E2A
MMWRHVVMVSLSLSLSLIHSSYPQDCPSRQDLMSSLRQAHKLLSAHEASYLQSLRTLRKKLSLLQGAALRLASRSNGTCPTLDTPANGRKLGKAMAVGHEVHFLCEPGFELVGSETRVCQESLSWSGQQPSCTNWSVLTNSSSASSRPSRCTQLQGSTHCTCEAGFTLSGRDSSLCTDIDECELFRSGRTGRLCVHACVNTAGSYRCACPAGYALAPDQRRCRDVDECASRQHNCTREDVCVNTYGGFQCVRPECPRPKSNATYVKTSPLRCERSPCPVDQQACAQAPSSVSFHYLPLVSNLSAPRVLFRVSAARVLGDSLRFGLLGGRGRRHFTVQRSDRRTGQLLLVSPVKGPAMLDAEMEMTELERGTVLGRYVTKVTLLVSPYDF